VRFADGSTRSADPAPAEGVPDAPRLYLASQSPRRQQLLREAGFDFEVALPPMDDGQLSSGNADPRQWVSALAYLKAHATASALHRPGDAPAMVLGADTIVLKGNQIIGKPEDETDARRILRLLAEGEHKVITGVAIVSINQPRDAEPDPEQRVLMVDSATVRVGHLSDDRIDAHIASNAWRGKAGGYNILDQLAYSWPITFDGDITTVMGLPMQRLAPVLRRALAKRSRRLTPRVSSVG